MKKFSAIAIALVIFSVSCKENTRVNLISGKVFQDCNTPLANVEIALKSNVGGSFNTPIILGSGITAADGTLRFTYELEEEDLGTGSLLLIKPTGFDVLVEDIELNQDVDRELFRNDSSQLIVQLLGGRMFSQTDTLYYGITSNEVEYSAVQPVQGVVGTVVVANSSPNVDNVSETVYFGVGITDFMRSKASASNADSTYNKQVVTLNGCGTETTTTLVID